MRYSGICGVLILLLVNSSPIATRAQSRPVPPALKRQVSAIETLLGEYRWSDGFSGESLKLLRNGRFTLHRGSDAVGYGTILHGNYALQKAVLVLSPEYAIPELSTKAHNSKERIQWKGKALRLSPVKWGARTYLLWTGKQEMEFCNAVNFGEEPIQASSWSIFYLRVGEETKPVVGVPQLAAPWRKCLLKSPIYATILSVGKDSTVVIDAGEAEGLKIGMGLTNIVGIWLEPEFIVASVKEHQATLRQKYPGVAIVSTGDRLSTRSAKYTEVLLLN